MLDVVIIVVVTVVIKSVHHLQMEILGIYLCIGFSSKAIFNLLRQQTYMIRCDELSSTHY